MEVAYAGIKIAPFGRCIPTTKNKKRILESRLKMAVRFRLHGNEGGVLYM